MKRELQVGDRVRLRGYGSTGQDVDGDIGILARLLLPRTDEWAVEIEPALVEVHVKASQCRRLKRRVRRRIYMDETEYRQLFEAARDPAKIYEARVWTGSCGTSAIEFLEASKRKQGA